ncbi:MAG: hypothetical protein RMZ42_19260 [Nostoc sp. DedQUE05]|uniref:hypothetical protein n=1 Tax=Nostoc sp. DedQUE05 TaxID=3075391 RepID=UPI002AD3B6E5|nr:hypothetical protein [Nostoc sp. DedQUE05]MDZ8094045.1 hypothetical protein [Nostoc sp. DedQUE05]
MIHTLTPEQEALIPIYREKWRAIAKFQGNDNPFMLDVTLAERTYYKFLNAVT